MNVERQRVGWMNFERQRVGRMNVKAPMCWRMNVDAARGQLKAHRERARGCTRPHAT